MEDCYFEKGITTFNTIHITLLMSDVINSFYILSQGGKNFGVDHNFFVLFLFFCFVFWLFLFFEKIFIVINILIFSDLNTKDIFAGRFKKEKKR